MDQAVERLPWDTAYFGLEIGRVVVPSDVPLAAAVSTADEEGLDCLYLLVPGEDAESLAEAQSLGFRVVDVRTELARPLPHPAFDLPADPTGRPAGPDDRPWVEALADDRFTHSRFVADGGFPVEAAMGMFRRWVQRGFDDPGQDVLVLGQRDGFVIVGRHGERGSIELIAASATAPRGVGGRLVQLAHDRLAARGCSAVTVVTQATNVSALRLYERTGYRVTASSYWLHRWRAEQPGRRRRDP